jgi:hypothetical protein
MRLNVLSKLILKVGGKKKKEEKERNKERNEVCQNLHLSNTGSAR